MRTVLLVVDVQTDFCEGGRLAVAGGNAVAKGISDLIMSNKHTRVYFTQDWHKPWPETNGGHFSETPDFVDSWPVHCEADLPGSEIHPDIARHAGVYNTFRKGHGSPDYSGFQGQRVLGRVSLNGHLSAVGAERLDICGIAGDHCVRATALDAVKAGYKVRILDNLVASVGGDDATAAMVREVRAASRA